MHRQDHIQIGLPNPCHEDWDKMSPCAQGRHCRECNTTVIDFSTWSDAALVSFFSKDYGRVCGNFELSQLGRPLHIPLQPHSKLYRMVVAMGLTLMCVQGADVYAQGRAPLAQDTVAVRPAAGEVWGRVLDVKLLPIAGAVVQLEQGGVVKAGAVTGADGRYSVKPPERGTYDLHATHKGSSITINQVQVSWGNVEQNLRIGAVPHKPANDAGAEPPVYFQPRRGQGLPSVSGARKTGTLYIIDSVQEQNGGGEIKVLPVKDDSLPQPAKHMDKKKNSK